MRRILVFQHIKREHPSLIAEYAAERGIELQVIALWEGKSIPDLSAYDALLVLGGPMGAYEEFPSKDAEVAAINDALQRKMPILGICLGSQLLAYALGARVYPFEQNGKKCKEIGYYDVSLTDEGKKSPLFAGFPGEFRILQWHGDTFELPSGATLLATAPQCPNQAFSYGTAYGLQFHMEATPGIVSEWIADDATWTHEGFAMDDEKVKADAERLSLVMREHCYRLMDNFLSI